MQIRQILDGVESLDNPILTVPKSASIDDAIDIFDKAKPQGTKLTDSELILTRITGRDLEFYVRHAANSRLYDVMETHEHIKKHWQS